MTKFTKEENAYIDQCFVRTKVIFIDDPKQRDNETDILFLVNYMHDKIGNIGPDNHKLMYSIFNKLGYCKDGKTTLEQERINVAKKEREAEKQWINDRNIALTRIDAKMAALEKLKLELEGKDKEFIERSKENKKLLLEDFNKKEKQKKEQEQKRIIKLANKQLNEMTVPELREVAKGKNIKNYSKMRKAELQAAIGEL
ncbi:MAG: Rho termination factor N-terminal domain-containing protein [Promethearchaeota archaeon]|jgi:hypothetical protein